MLNLPLGRIDRAGNAFVDTHYKIIGGSGHGRELLRSASAYGDGTGRRVADSSIEAKSYFSSLSRFLVNFFTRS